MVSQLPSPLSGRELAPLIWLFAAALAVLAAGMGLRDPWPTDEPRFALIAKQMYEGGSWIVPMRGIEYYSDKPPVFFWLQALALSLGVGPRIAFLLPSLLASLGTLLLVCDLGRRLWTPRVGIWAGVLLLFSMHFVFQGKKAQIDPTLVFWTTLSAYAMLRHLLTGPRWGWYFIAWFVAGLGIITKGVGFLPLLLLPIYVVVRMRGGFRLPAIRASDPRWYLLAIGLPLAVAIWLVPVAYVLLSNDDPKLWAWARDIFLRQTADRYLNPWHQTGKGSFHYVGVVVLMWMPLSLSLPWLVPAWWRRIRRRADPRFLLPLLWVALVIAFFSLSPGKRDVYILPALPMLALAAAPLMEGIARKAAWRWMVFAAAAILAAALAVAGLAALVGDPAFELRAEASRGLSAGDSAWWMLLTTGGVGLIGVLWARPRRALSAWAAAWVPVWILAFGFWGYPLLNDASSGRAVMEKARSIAGEGADIALVAWRPQNMYHLTQPYVDFGTLRPWRDQFRDAVTWLGEEPQRRRIFSQRSAVEDCIDPDRAISLGVANRREWVLIGADSLIPGCALRK